MLVSLNWLKQYTEIPEDISMEQLAYDLTMRTVEVEGYKNPAEDYQGVVLGEILEISAHPNADRLRVCRVDIGGDHALQIVCGGKNLYEGELVVVAAPGARVRWHGEGEPVEIAPTKMRGVESEGMICAADELDLAPLFPATEEGIIMDLSEFAGARAGQSLADVLELDDMIIEIDNKSLTNRPDLWGHYGLARELAAIYGQELKKLPEFQPEGVEDSYKISIENLHDCPRYSASIWTGLKNEPSPFALQKQLYLLGHNPHGLIVDLSNYLMLAIGQPNHTYDLDQVGQEINIRRAKPGEKLCLIDEIDLELSPEHLVIATGDKAIALAGIKGGQEESISDDTSDIVLELANFRPELIRKTSKYYDLRTDAEARFEKGLDLEGVDRALGLFQALVKEYCPGAKLQVYSDEGKKKTAPCRIHCERKFMTRRLGRDLRDQEIEKQLKPLGYKLDFSKDSFEVTVPSWRATGDVSMPSDMVEELARMIGYENFDFVPPEVKLHSYVRENTYDRNRKLREFLAHDCGLQEIYLYPWTDIFYQKLCGYPDEQSIEIAAPPSPEERYLKQSLIPGLLEAALKNNRYYEDFAIFESASVFHKSVKQETPGYHFQDSDALPQQEVHLAALKFGQDAWQLFRELKGMLEYLPLRLNYQKFEFVQEEKPLWADPAVYLNLKLGDKIVGHLGLVSAYVKKSLGLKRGNMAVFEFRQDALVPSSLGNHDYVAIPQYPLVEMDISLVLPEEVSWSDVQKYIRKRVDDLSYIGEYRSNDMAEGSKSLTFRVRFGKSDGTLSSEEIEAKRASLLKTLKHTLGAVLRQ